MKLSDLMQATFKNVGEELGLNISVVNALSECCTFAVLEEGLFTAVQRKTFFSAREKFLLCTPVNRESQSNRVYALVYIEFSTQIKGADICVKEV